MPNLLGHDGHNLLLHSFLLKNFRYTFPNAHTGQLPPLLDIYKAYADLMPTARRSSWKKSATRRFSLKAVILIIPALRYWYGCPSWTKNRPEQGITEFIRNWMAYPGA